MPARRGSRLGLLAVVLLDFVCQHSLHACSSILVSALPLPRSTQDVPIKNYRGIFDLETGIGRSSWREVDELAGEVSCNIEGGNLPLRWSLRPSAHSAETCSPSFEIPSAMLARPDFDAAPTRDVPFEKRGGKGMNRHLIAAALSASLAVVTATLSLAANSLKAHDQDQYGVSKKTNLADKKVERSQSSSMKRNNADDEERVDMDEMQAEDESGSPSSAACFNKHNWSCGCLFPPRWETLESSSNGQQLLDSTSCPEAGEKDDDGGGEQPMKRGINMKKYDKWAPLLEKVEDYGKVTAAVGALGAALAMTYAATRAHFAYKTKALEKAKEDDDDDDHDDHDGKGRHEKKIRARDVWDGTDVDLIGLVPSILPSRGKT